MPLTFDFCRPICTVIASLLNPFGARLQRIDDLNSHVSDVSRRPGLNLPSLLSGPRGQFVGAVFIGAMGALALAVSLVGPAPLALCAVLLAFLAASTLATVHLGRGYPHASVGWCNLVTLARLVLVCALLATVFAPASVLMIVGVASVALALDGLDGCLARKQGFESDFGARFDMEVDAALGMVLAIGAWSAGTVGLAVLLLGLPRYGFAAAAWQWPWINKALPARFGRKVVCVVQIVALIALQVPSLSGLPAVIVLLVALVALGWSFGRDLRWLWQSRA